MAQNSAHGTPWLVAIDMQTIFGDPSSPWSSAGYGDASAGIRRLLPRFADRVIYTRFIAPEHPVGSWVPYYKDWSFALVPADDPLYDVTSEFDTAGHSIVSRTTFGKWGEELAAAMHGSTEMVLAGVSTDCCVLSTALGAADAGVHVRVVSDACAGVSPADHQRALDAMALYGPLIEIVTVDQVLADSA
ncbi:cysteine hydrolase family protein [Rathayibacter soli]|uniref:cysteine hydrolase family protein n=1 Tax=Rathayibacter soli TaxID=3144168 RepID=UPI0027E49FCE|nr:cysteine hydrolase [Glaciibacter superstes]